jgi:hypothetical protein
VTLVIDKDNAFQILTRFLTLRLHMNLQEYRPLIIELYGNTLVKPTVKGCKKNYNMLVDVRRLLSLAVIILLL